MSIQFVEKEIVVGEMDLVDALSIYCLGVMKLRLMREGPYKKAFQYDANGLIRGDRLADLVYAQEIKAIEELKADERTQRICRAMVSAANENVGKTQIGFNNATQA